MSLKEYRTKRDFGKTPEPGGRSAARTPDEALIYVIQKHDASRLHYDLRLEESGVLSSWAVPKEPPSGPGVRRLAVRTEDHPIEYASFEGIIPEPEYGAGTVEIWDRGTYVPVEMSESKKVFDLEGRRLTGRYNLVKIKPRKGEKDVNWLFFKSVEKGPSQ